MAKKLRTRKHEVVLNRSAGGDAGITLILTIFGFARSISAVRLFK